MQEGQFASQMKLEEDYDVGLRGQDVKELILQASKSMGGGEEDSQHLGMCKLQSCSSLFCKGAAKMAVASN